MSWERYTLLIVLAAGALGGCGKDAPDPGGEAVDSNEPGADAGGDAGEDSRADSAAAVMDPGFYWEAPPDGVPLLNGESLALWLGWQSGDGAPLSVGLRRRALDGPDAGRELWATPQGEWSEDPTERVSLASGETAQLELPVAEASAAEFTLEAVDLSGEVALTDAESGEAAALDWIALGRGMAWGDLHAHSNLSHDGCENQEVDCDDRGDGPGEDFFAQARERELDFAAITDHAEWSRYVSAAGEAYDIWPEQLALAQAADAEGFVPLVGYEWSWSARTPEADEPFDGGHKTVVFEDLEICEAYRVAAGEKTESYQKADGDGYTEPGNDYTASKPGMLWDALDAAAEDCGEQRLLSFFHHTALLLPQPADWLSESNAPEPRYEPLVEMYSEHGCSECWDPEADGCGWNLRPETEYIPRGSVQAALSQGYKLGFTAGTDAHDARPGSTRDGPSCVAHLYDPDGKGRPDTLQCHEYGGGLTGALHAGVVARGALFDALLARNTVATSGPRVPLAVAARGADGVWYLPGDELPAAAMPAQLVGDPAGDLVAVGAELLAVELIDPSDGSARALEAGDGELLAVTLDLAPGEVRYLRVRAQWGEEEHRVWASPFFGGE